MGKGILLSVLFILANSYAGPVPEDVTEANLEEVCMVKNVTYSKGEIIPDVAPCESCHCEPPNVVCSMIKCQQNNGCKIIQQPNRCCPEYKCECELDGKIFNNGEKLVNSLDPCHVCYCRGGEIMCTSITCYVRDDCAPQFISGRCCPKYDHCPPVDARVPSRAVNSTTQSSKREMQPWLLTKGLEHQTTPSGHHEDSQVVIKYPQTIKIVEILPTTFPSKSNEFSSGPRIITNGDSQDKRGGVEVLSFDSDVNEEEIRSTTEEMLADNVTEVLKNSTSEKYDLNKTKIEFSPDSEWFTTIWPQGLNMSTELNETDEFSSVTEGTGYSLLTGGVFSSENAQETTEVHGTDKSLVTSETYEPALIKSTEVELIEDFRSTTFETPSSYTSSESQPKEDSVTTNEPEISSTLQQFKILNNSKSATLTIPPVVNLNEQVQYTKFNSRIPESDKNAPKVHVYSPTNPDEVSEMTVVKTSSYSPLDDDHTQPILLTPDDLKTLAEILIHEKIKPVPGESDKLVSNDNNTTSVEITTEVMTEISEGTTFSGLESNSTSETEENVIDHSETEIFNTESTPKRNLTEEEKWSLSVMDKVTSNILLPLEGIELINNTNTSSLITEGYNATQSETSPIFGGENETELTSNENSSQEIIEETSSTETTSENISSTIEETTTSNFVSSRGSSRNINEKKPQDVDELQRKVRITGKGDVKDFSQSVNLFDERDRMLVENFFKKNLDVD